MPSGMIVRVQQPGHTKCGWRTTRQDVGRWPRISRSSFGTRISTAATSTTTQSFLGSSTMRYHAPRRRPCPSARLPRLRAQPMSAMLPPHEHEYGSLWHDEIRLSFERDFDGGLAEEQRVVSHLSLHREVLHVGAMNLPRLLVHAGGFGHRCAGTGRDDAAALYLATFDC